MSSDPARLFEAPRKPAEWIGNRERGSSALLKVMVFMSLRLGRRASRSVLYGIALYFFLFAPAARRNSRRYLRLALGRAPTAVDRFRHVLYFATCIHDRVYLVKQQYGRFRITIDGEELMRGALESGRGAFLMGAHLGSFEVLRSVARRQPGLNVSMAMYEHNARKINAMMAAVDPYAKADIVALGEIDAMLRISDRLERGGFVGMLGDRTLSDEPLQSIQLLGARAQLPVGPMRAAAILRRPVFFMAGLYRGANRYHLVFETIADFSTTAAGQRESAIASAVERYAALLDRYCRSDPYNWFNFFDFWRERSGKS
ncbi:MAG: acyl-CoA synthetase [Steroidobacteraceae bacterium]